MKQMYRYKIPWFVAESWVKKVGGAGSCNFLTEFQQTVAKFGQKRLRVLRISTLPPNFPNMGFFKPEFCIFRQNFFDKKKLFGQFSNCPQMPPLLATAPLDFKRHSKFSSLFASL